jgi:hypothetical protein
MFEHRLRRLLGNTKGKVIGRDRKENYEKLLNSFYLQRFINVREIKRE